MALQKLERKKMRDDILDIVVPICLTIVICFSVLNIRGCSVEIEKLTVEKAKICKEAGGFYQLDGKCVKNPGVSQ